MDRACVRQASDNYRHDKEPGDLDNNEMRFLVTILLFSSCVASKKVPATTVVLDGSASKIKGGNGHGYFTKWSWRQIKGPVSTIKNPSAQVTQATIGPGDYEWELTGTDNLNNTGKDTLKINY